MKGEFTHPRTLQMLEIALMHARACFESSCGSRLLRTCMVYGGSAWNGGAHLTVIIDRCVCALHAPRVPFAAVETWVYDISGPSPIYLGKGSLPQNVELLAEPGDLVEAPASPTFLKR